MCREFLELHIDRAIQLYVHEVTFIVSGGCLSVICLYKLALNYMKL